MAKAEAAFPRTTRDLRHHHRLALRQPADEGAVRRRLDARDRRERRRRSSRSSREDQDAFALRSQQRAAAAQAAGCFASEIVPVDDRRSGRATRSSSSSDEHPRPDTTLEALAKLQGRRAPGRHGDGRQRLRRQRRRRALMLASSEAAAERYGLTPRARVVGHGDGRRARRASWASARRRRSRKVLARLGLTLDADRRDRAQRGVRRAGARRAAPARPRRRRRARQPERRRDRARPSARHARRAARRRRRVISCTRRGGRYALCTMCIGVGQGIALVIERV